MNIEPTPKDTDLKPQVWYRDKRMLHSRWIKIVLGFLVTATVGLIIAAVVVRHTYLEALRPVDPNGSAVTITVPSGASASEIADMLKGKSLIRSDWAFEWYVRSQNARDKLQAGTYEVSPSQSIAEIVSMLTGGVVATDLVTIVPGKRLDEIKDMLVKLGYTNEEINSALEPLQYSSHPALSDKPAESSLEGYLYPESFQVTQDTKLSVVIGQALDEMQKRLTPDIRASIAKQGISVHEAVILASIVEQEVSKPEDRAQAAQVFLKRLRIGMMLGSDVTAFYGARINNVPVNLRDVSYDTPYNTRLHTGLPPGPIGNFTSSSLEAIANPAATDWLYFVSGDDGITRFSKTIDEHERNTELYCFELCGR